MQQPLQAAAGHHLLRHLVQLHRAAGGQEGEPLFNSCLSGRVQVASATAGGLRYARGVENYRFTEYFENDVLP